MNNQADHSFQGFSKLTREERFDRLLKMGALTPQDSAYLRKGGVETPALGEKLIENVIGYFQMPLGVATHFFMDGRDYVIPMAVEETSIIAAFSKTAKWIRREGTITTRVEGRCILGQIQFPCVKDFARLTEVFEANRIFLIEQVNEHVAQSMVKRGGGVENLELRRLSCVEGPDMAVIHLTMNCCDAMGANLINQVLEYLKPPLEQLTGERVGICILSNLNDQKLTHATITLQGVDADLGMRLQEASVFAESCPYRAATHNKGVMNGMDGVLIATGNDWRAVEAGVHAYAARKGRYQAITQWRYANNVLTGHLTAPLVVGTVGGVTAVHPTAELCLRMMHIESANHLSRVIAAVGLVQNLGALTALCTEGIIQGHMKLHLDNLLLVAGASEHEIPVLKVQLARILQNNKRIGLSEVKELLAGMRNKTEEKA